MVFTDLDDNSTGRYKLYEVAYLFTQLGQSTPNYLVAFYHQRIGYSGLLPPGENWLQLEVVYSTFHFGQFLRFGKN